MADNPGPANCRTITIDPPRPLFSPVDCSIIIPGIVEINIGMLFDFDSGDASYGAITCETSTDNINWTTINTAGGGGPGYSDATYVPPLSRPGGPTGAGHADYGCMTFTDLESGTYVRLITGGLGGLVDALRLGVAVNVGSAQITNGIALADGGAIDGGEFGSYTLQSPNLGGSGSGGSPCSGSSFTPDFKVGDGNITAGINCKPPKMSFQIVSTI
jgi:hypothetical protein